MINPYFLPMLLAGILCMLLSITTWLFRRRESINRVFALFTFALAIDAFTFFWWYQYGDVAEIRTWMPIIFTAGFIVPFGLLFFFYAFTGYDKHRDDKVLGIRVKHFMVTASSFIILVIILSYTTHLILRIPPHPENVWDIEFGLLGNLMFPLFGGIFVYLFSMAIKAYRQTTHPPQKRFILLLTSGAAVWLIIGYASAAMVPTSGLLWQAMSYIGTAGMAVFFFVAILNYQYDQVHELNVGLERKVEERTRHLEETRSQLVQSEKMAALGHLVAGVAHEMNSPVGAIYSTHSTLDAALKKLRTLLLEQQRLSADDMPNLDRILTSMDGVSHVVKTSGERITSIVKRLKVFARLDEANVQKVDFNECVQNTLDMFQFHLKPGVRVETRYTEMPVVTCYPAEINQLCLQLLTNANLAIEGEGTITLETELDGDQVVLKVSDSGRGISAENLGRVFDPGYTSWKLSVGAGLGLAICYQIAQLHRGKIEVVSKLGEGSQFTFRFPSGIETA